MKLLRNSSAKEKLKSREVTRSTDSRAIWKQVTCQLVFLPIPKLKSDERRRSLMKKIEDEKEETKKKKKRWSN